MNLKHVNEKAGNVWWASRLGCVGRRMGVDLIEKIAWSAENRITLY